MMMDFGVAFDKLASMDSAIEIADFFLDQGVQAKRADATSCAISVWMGRETGLDVRTNCSSVRSVRFSGGCSEGCCDDIETVDFMMHTDAMRDFVDAFDNGKFPALIEDKYDRGVCERSLNGA